MNLPIPKCKALNCPKVPLFESDSSKSAYFLCEEHFTDYYATKRQSQTFKPPKVYSTNDLNTYIKEFESVKQRLKALKIEYVSTCSDIIEIIKKEFLNCIVKIDSLLINIDKNIQIITSNQNIFESVLNSLNELSYIHLFSLEINPDFIENLFKDLLNWNLKDKKNAAPMMFHKLIDSRIVSNNVTVEKKAKLLNKTLRFSRKDYNPLVFSAKHNSKVNYSDFFFDISHIQVSLKSNLLVTASRDQIFFWTLNRTLFKIIALKPGHEIFALFLLKKNKVLIVIYREHGVSLINTQSFTETRSHLNTETIVLHKVSKDESTLLLADHSGTLTIFNLNPFSLLCSKPVHSFSIHIPAFTCLDISNNAKHIASGGNDRKLVISLNFKETNPYLGQFYFSGIITAVKFSPNSETLIVACEDNWLSVYQLQSVERPKKIKTSAPVREIVFTEDSKYFLTGSPNNVLYWETLKLTPNKLSKSKLDFLIFSIPEAVIYKKYIIK